MTPLNPALEFDICGINALGGKSVNASGVIQLGDTPPCMGKKSTSEPSPFWKRLTECWNKHGLPTTQNGVATRLGMSQGSTRRWYTGEGMPDRDVLIRMADLGHVDVDWLLRGTLPVSAPAKGTPLRELLEIWEACSDAGRTHILTAARGQAAIQGAAYLGLKKSPDRRTA